MLAKIEMEFVNSKFTQPSNKANHAEVKTVASLWFCLRRLRRHVKN